MYIGVDVTANGSVSCYVIMSSEVRLRDCCISRHSGQPERKTCETGHPHWKQLDAVAVAV